MRRISLLFSAMSALLLAPTTAFADCSDQFFVYGEQSLDLADRVTVGRAPIGSTGTAELGVDTLVHGNLVGGAITLRNRAILNGTAYTNSAVTLQAGAAILGLTQPLGAQQTCTSPPTPVVTPGSDDGFAASSLNLPPGHYRHFSVGVGATLVVEGGDYHFASIVFEPDTRLVGVWTGAPARIFVRDAVFFGDRHQQAAVRPRGTTVGGSVIEIHSLQSHQLRLGTDATIESRIVAPFAEVNVPSRTVVKAPLYGQRVRVEPDVTLGEGGNVPINVCQ